MKTKCYILIGLFFFSTIALHAQQGVTIQSGGVVTVNGNLIIMSVANAQPCPGIPTITDSRDGKVYPTVLIGNQCWMGQNLNVGIKIPGPSSQTDNSTLEKYCYNDLESNCDIYGGLYQWDEAMQYATTPGVQGICPTGWHFPTDAEWTTLTTFLGGEGIAGTKMKSSAGWYNNGNGNNSSGFTAIPGGLRVNNGSFFSLTTDAYFWSSSQPDATNTWSRYLYYLNIYVTRGSLYPDTYGYSVRCILN